MRMGTESTHSRYPPNPPFVCLDPHCFALESDDHRQGDKICTSRSVKFCPFFVLANLKDDFLVFHSPILSG